jgi:hypothetical protein
MKHPTHLRVECCRELTVNWCPCAAELDTGVVPEPIDSTVVAPPGYITPD